MSSSKRRKLDLQQTPSSTVSAVSALAARRRQAAGAAAAADEDTPSPAGREDTPSSSRANPFSILQTLKQQNDASNSPSKGSPRPRRDAKSRGDIQRASTDDTAEALSAREIQDPASSVLSSQLTQYSSFRLTKRNHRQKSSSVTELRLEDSERFIIHGSFGIRVVSGEVTVAGATLRPSDLIYWIHAPLCHALPVLRTIENTHIELHQDRNAHGLRKLERLSPLFRRIWNESSETIEAKPSKESTFKIICTSEDAPNRGVVQELISPPEWNKELASLASPVRKGASFSTLVCGPKSAGKSTFSKLLVNRLLTRDGSSSSLGVLVLDLDPGQPEFAPPGTVSLVHIMQPNLGTPFTHASLDDGANRVVRCHALASVTPASAPDFYLECVFDLFSAYRQSYKDHPLVINTPGWILGTGLDLLDQIIRHVSPQEVLYMSEDGPGDSVETLRAATSNRFITLPSQQSEFTSRTAAHLRAMQAMSYFHTKASEALESPRLSWVPSPLSTIPPWHVRYSGPDSGILGILSYDDQSPPELLAETVNGMVLAAVEIENPMAFNNMRQAGAGVVADRSTTGAGNSPPRPTISRTPEGLPFIPNTKDIALDPRSSHTIGLVLVRGIDVAAQTLQIITPISQKTIEQVKAANRDIVLVHGKFDTPNWAYTEDLYERSAQHEAPDTGGPEVMDEDTSEDDSEVEPERVDDARDVTAIPWVEVLKGNEKRPVGSRVWRVRRDLGRSAGD